MLSLQKRLYKQVIFCFAAVISVEPTYAYYEKVSEELERIVHEVKEKEEVEPLSHGEKLLN